MLSLTNGYGFGITKRGKPYIGKDNKIYGILSKHLTRFIPIWRKLLSDKSAGTSLDRNVINYTLKTWSFYQLKGD